MTFANGTLGVVSNTRYNGRGYDVRLEVHGSKDSVAAGVDEGWPIRATQPGVDFPSGLFVSFEPSMPVFVPVGR